MSQFHALSYQRQRFLGMVDQVGSLFHRLHVHLRISNITAHEVSLLQLEINSLHLRIARQVEHHRTGSSALGNVESATHCPCDILCMTNLIAPFGDWLGNTHEVNLLESICTQDADAHLTGNDDDWCGIHHRISDTCQRVCSTRSAGNNTHTDLTAHPCKTFCRMGCSLFMTNQDMVECFLLASGIIIQGIIYRHDTAAWIAEDGFHTFRLQCQHQCF